MALTKRTYVDEQTLITAANLNSIQDEIIANGEAITGLTPLTGTADPTTATAGAVKQLYLNTSTHKLFMCTAVSGSVYTWVKASSAGLTFTDSASDGNIVIAEEA